MIDDPRKFLTELLLRYPGVEVETEVLPSEVKYIAQDGTGVWFGYCHEPVPPEDGEDFLWWAPRGSTSLYRVLSPELPVEDDWKTKYYEV